MSGPGRSAPANLDAERALLGAMLLTPAAIDAAALAVGPDDFHSPAHGHIYAAVVDLHADGHPVDAVTVADRLASTGVAGVTGGLAELITLVADTPSTGGAARYARIVADKALLRRLIGAAGEITEAAYGDTGDVDATLDDAERAVLAVATGRVDDTATVRTAEVVDDHLAAVATRGDAVVGLRTGWADLDDMLTPLRPGNCVVVAARPATGKTAFALGLAASAALDQDAPVLVCSMEMSTAEVVDRLLASLARVDLTRITTGALTVDDWDRLDDARRRLKASPHLHVDDTASPTMLQIAAKARRVRAASGRLGMVVVDYAELVGERRDETEALRVASIARGCKNIAKELGCVVVLLSQVKRSVDERADKRPQLGDLSASGGLEAAADVVLCLYRDELYEPNSADRGVVEVLVRKARQGRTGTVKLAYLGAHTRFGDLARR